jgi:DNA-3-methyladenine glycosylase II
MIERLRFTIVPRKPYSLGLTVEHFGRYPEVVDVVVQGVYRRLLPVGGALLLLSVTQRGAPTRARLHVELQGSGARSAPARLIAEKLVLQGLGAALDVRPFYREFRDDPILGRPIRRCRGLRVACWPSVWEALVTAILSQQVNLSFAYSIRRELALAFGRRRRIDGQTFIAFPTPRRVARVTTEELRRFRLSRTKSRAVHSLAEAFSSGRLCESRLEALPDDEVVTRLTEFHGVGRWTAEIALLRGLARPDAFPAADLGVVKYVARGLLGRRDVATEDEMRGFAERWRPYRGLALAYAYAELQHRASTATASSTSRRSQ